MLLSLQVYEPPRRQSELGLDASPLLAVSRVLMTLISPPVRLLPLKLELAQLPGDR